MNVVRCCWKNHAKIGVSVRYNNDTGLTPREHHGSWARWYGGDRVTSDMLGNMRTSLPHAVITPRVTRNQSNLLQSTLLQSNLLQSTHHHSLNISKHTSTLVKWQIASVHIYSLHNSVLLKINYVWLFFFKIWFKHNIAYIFLTDFNQNSLFLNKQLIMM